MLIKTYEQNGYTFSKQESGTTTAKGELPSQGTKCGSRVTPKGMQPGDQRGHLIAAQEGGPNKMINMTAQDGKLNQGAYKTVETQEVNLAHQGNHVHLSKTAFVSNQPGQRPDAYMVNDTITTPEGKTQHVHLSFQNISPQEQEKMNLLTEQHSSIEDFQNPDPLRESTHNEDYTQLMEETDQQLSSLKDEFDLSNTTEYNFCENTDTSAVSSNGCGEEGTCADAGTDCGADAGCEI